MKYFLLQRVQRFSSVKSTDNSTVIIVITHAIAMTGCLTRVEDSNWLTSAWQYASCRWRQPAGAPARSESLILGIQKRVWGFHHKFASLFIPGDLNSHACEVLADENEPLTKYGFRDHTARKRMVSVRWKIYLKSIKNHFMYVPVYVAVPFQVSGPSFTTQLQIECILSASKRKSVCMYTHASMLVRANFSSGKKGVFILLLATVSLKKTSHIYKRNVERDWVINPNQIRQVNRTSSLSTSFIHTCIPIAYH